ncbi:MAG: group I intron-associated PD-(D/E)XK endonuclease, partial [Solirubrobacterales bacterium]|nr:group I intron-associated PD-(D/E)XK endonuclease [Solirubrobacterales bacterium]
MTHKSRKIRRPKASVGAEASPSQKGRMAEASIAMVATNLGWDVYLPFGDGSRADMVLQDTNGEVFRTQVKWGRLDGEV